MQVLLAYARWQKDQIAGIGGIADGKKEADHTGSE